MRRGVFNDLQEIGNARKTAVIDHELHRLLIDIATRRKRSFQTADPWGKTLHLLLAGERSRGKQGSWLRLCHQEHAAPHSRALNRLLRANSHPTPLNIGRLFELCAHLDQFYDQLDATSNRIPTSEHVYLLGEFNAIVGADRELGQNGIGKHE